MKASAWPSVDQVLTTRGSACRASTYPRQIRPGERGETKRKAALRPGGQKGCFRSSRKCMNRMPKKFANVLVSRVYLLTKSRTASKLLPNHTKNLEFLLSDDLPSLGRTCES